ncbi:hypothetical protein F5148DRAFT_890321 [Russula earlei]|uniref:Uncharacterized protein n=1 Tax=Russula earlei TaxID=71964 RepID=A0ACC0TRT2_9AGAM|nr:hypothetical protein F5148DRAFT_890321 [Russula earlei]
MSTYQSCHYSKSTQKISPLKLLTSPKHMQQFIYNQQHHNSHSKSDISVSDLPIFYGKITIYPSAVAMFHAPSNISGIGSMCS